MPVATPATADLPRPVPKAHYEQQLRKLAAGMNSSPDAEFSRAFAALGITHLSRNPKILDNLVGFQLLDRSDDDVKAAGLFAAQVDKMLFYVPLIFVNGRIKCHDLLYCKSIGAVVPNKEKWVGLLTQQGLQDSGSPLPKPESRKSWDTPDYRSLQQPPQTYKAGALSQLAKLRARKEAEQRSLEQAPLSWRQEFRVIHEDLRELFFGKPEAMHKAASERLSLPNLLDRSLQACQRLFAWRDQYPVLYKMAQKHHGADVLTRALQKWAARLAAKAQAPRPKLTLRKDAVMKAPSGVEMIVIEERTYIPDVPDSVREQALQDGYLVNDQRSDDAVSALCVNDDSPDRNFLNPSSSGCYRTLQDDGTLADRIIIRELPQHRGQNALCLVVDPKNSGKAAVMLPSTAVWVTEEGCDREAWDRWFKSLSPAKASSMTDSKTYMLLTPTGKGYGPFGAAGQVGMDSVNVHMAHHLISDVGSPLSVTGSSLCDRNTEAKQLTINYIDKGSVHAVQSQQALLISGPVSLLEIKDSMSSSVGTCQAALPRSAVVSFLHKSAYNLKLAMSREGFKFSCDRPLLIPDTPLDRINSTRWLVEVLGVREKSAKALLDAAEARYTAKAVLRPAAGYPNHTKFAEIMYPQNRVGSAPMGDPQQPMSSGNPLYEQLLYPQEEHQAVPMEEGPEDFFDMNEASKPRVTEGPDPELIQATQDAGAAGMGEVMDTGFMTALLQQRDLDSLIAEDTPYMFMTLDKLGRQLLMMSYRPELYQERFGDADAPVLEDMTRSLFHQLGDYMSTLKEKDVSPLPNLDTAESSVGLSSAYRA